MLNIGDRVIIKDEKFDKNGELGEIISESQMEGGYFKIKVREGHPLSPTINGKSFDILFALEKVLIKVVIICAGALGC